MGLTFPTPILCFVQCIVLTRLFLLLLWLFFFFQSFCSLEEFVYNNTMLVLSSVPSWMWQRPGRVFSWYWRVSFPLFPVLCVLPSYSHVKAIHSLYCFTGVIIWVFLWMFLLNRWFTRLDSFKHPRKLQSLPFEPLKNSLNKMSKYIWNICWVFVFTWWFIRLVEILRSLLKPLWKL